MEGRRLKTVTNDLHNAGYAELYEQFLYSPAHLLTVAIGPFNRTGMMSTPAQTALHRIIALGLALAALASEHQFALGSLEEGLAVHHWPGRLVGHPLHHLAASAFPASAFAWPRFRRVI